MSLSVMQLTGTLPSLPFVFSFYLLSSLAIQTSDLDLIDFIPFFFYDF